MTDDRGQKTEDSSENSHPSSVIRHLLFWPVFIGGLVLDLWTKSAVFAWLKDRGQDGFSIIDGFLRFQLAENAGAAFGIAHGHRELLVTVSVIAVLVVLALFLFGPKESKLFHLTLALFAAGVCGNLYDRLKTGMVRDFIDVVYWPGKHWPAFNVADTLLCVAVGLFIISSLISRPSSQKPAQPQK
jgi:signal peptidase II